MDHKSNGVYCPAYEDIRKVHTKLDSQQEHISNLISCLENQTRVLIEAVTGGKKSVPIIVHLIIVAALTTVIFVLLIRDSDKSLRVNRDGFHLEQRENK